MVLKFSGRIRNIGKVSVVTIPATLIKDNFLKHKKYWFTVTNYKEKKQELQNVID